MSSVLVIGYFNVLHAGHVRHLRACSEVGDVYVGIYNDIKNRELCGDKAVPLMERIECLRACKYVRDVLVIENELSAANKVRPDFFGGHETDEFDADDLGLKKLRLALEPVLAKPDAVEAKRPAAWLAY